MHSVAGFKIECQIVKNSYPAIYRAVRTEDNKPVILKVLKDDYPSRKQISTFGLKTDLDRCLKQLNVGQDPEVPPGNTIGLEIGLLHRQPF